MGCCESNNPKAKVKQNLNNNTKNNTQTQSYNTTQVNQVIQQNGFNQKTVSNVSNGNFIFTQFQTTTTQDYGMDIFDDEDFKEAKNKMFSFRTRYAPNIIQINQKMEKEKNLENLIKLDKNYSFTGFQKESLEKHNYYRRMHHVCDLQLSDELCEIAQNYADYLAANNKFEHSHDKFKGEAMGENLFYITGAKPDGNKAVDSWYEEIEDYDFETGKSINGNKIGHLTQVLWKESKYLGVGLGYNDNTYTVVANYFPSGNFIGRYTENVFPK